MPTALYARVSTEAQEKQQTIESQLAELRRYAQAKGLQIAREFGDDGCSGTMLERPGLDALRDFVAAGGAETVLALCSPGVPPVPALLTKWHRIVNSPAGY